jgi:hypothetical protein
MRKQPTGAGRVHPWLVHRGPTAAQADFPSGETVPVKSRSADGVAEEMV